MPTPVTPSLIPTPTPWVYLNPDEEGCIAFTQKDWRDGGLIGLVYPGEWNVPAEADAKRIVQCVNACAGFDDPDALPDVVRALKGMLTWAQQSVAPVNGAEFLPRGYEKWRAALARLEGQTTPEQKP